jgi:hypothetical protein
MVVSVSENIFAPIEAVSTAKLTCRRDTKNQQKERGRRKFRIFAGLAFVLNLSLVLSGLFPFDGRRKFPEKVGGRFAFFGAITRL